MRTVDMRLVAVDADGTPAGSLPDHMGIEWAAPSMDLPTLRITYPDDAPRSELLAPGRWVAVELAVTEADGTRGDWFEPPNARFLCGNGGWNRAEGRRVWQVDAIGARRLLDGELVGYEGESNADGDRNWSTATAGQVMRQAIVDAQAREWPSGLPWFPQLEVNFDAAADSSGAAWTTQYPFTAPRQQTIAFVLDKLVGYGMCEWEFRGWELWLANTDGALRRDLSGGANPLILRDAHSSDAPEKFTLDDLCTDVDFVGDEGVHWQFGNLDPWREVGRFVRPVSQGSVSLEGTARLHADRLLVPGAAPRKQYTRGGTNGAARFLPWVDVRNGDRVLIEADGGLEPVDVLGVTVSRTSGGVVEWHFTLGDRIDGILTRLADRAELAVAGAGVAGGDGTPPRPPGPDAREPEQVGAVAWSTALYLDDNGAWRGLVSLAWPPVERATDDTVIEELGGYEVWARATGELEPRLVRDVPGDRTQADLAPLEAGSAHEVTVRAVSLTGVPGAFSAPIVATVADDVTPPPVPTAPVLSSLGGTVTVQWDGLGVGVGGNVPMPPDWRSVRVWHYGESQHNTAELVGEIVAAGDSVILPLSAVTGTFAWFALSSVDRWGNESERTAPASTLVRSIADDPEVVNELGAELAVDSAFIGSLRSVVVVSEAFEGKIFEGGTFRSTGADGSRVEFTSDGYAQYDNLNRLVASWTPQHGFRLFDPTAGHIEAQLGRLADGSTSLAVRDPASARLVPLGGQAFGSRATLVRSVWKQSTADFTDTGWVYDSAVTTFTVATDRAMCTISAGAMVVGARTSAELSYRIQRVSTNATVYGPTLSGDNQSVILRAAPPQVAVSWEGTLTHRHPVVLTPGTYRAQLAVRLFGGNSGFNEVDWTNRSIVIDPA